MNEDLIKLFFEYFDFLKSNNDIDSSSAFSKYKIYLKDEKEKINKFFNNYLKINTFKSFDVENFNSFLENIYISLKVLQRELFESRNPYMTDSKFLDNIIKSLAIEHPELINFYIKPKFSHDIVNMFKRKGTIETLKKAMSYFYLLPIEIFEVWLIEENNELYFKSRSRNINYIKNTDFDINIISSYNSQISDDPHWYLEYDQIKKLNNSLDQTGLGLPSLTPYIKIVNAPNILKFRMQYIQLIRNVHYEYNYFLQNNNLDNFRLLYHNDTESYVSITELILLVCYLYNKRYYRNFVDEKDQYFQFSNVTKEFDETEYSEIDRLTRKYEYDELKKQYYLYSSRPLLKTDYSTLHGFVFENKKDNIKISDVSNYYERILIKQENIEINNLFNFVKKPKDYFVDIYGNNIVISGGLNNDNELIDTIINTNVVDFNSFNQNSITLPINLKNHLCIFRYNSIIVLGGTTDNNILNNNIYYYDYNSDNWYIYPNISFSGNINKYLFIDDNYILIQKDNGEILIYNPEMASFSVVDLDSYINQLQINITDKLNIDWDSNNENIVILFKTDKVILNLKRKYNATIVDTTFPDLLFDINGLYFDSFVLHLNDDLNNEINNNSYIFINESNEIKIITENNIFITNKLIFDNDIFLLWNSYNFKWDYDNSLNYRKIKVNNKYYLFLSNNTQNISFCIKFESEKVPYYSYDEKTSLKLINDLKRIKNNNKKIFTYEDIFNASNRHAAKENLNMIKKLFQEKGDSYLYKEANFDTNLDLSDLIDINNDDYLIDNIEQIKQLLILLNDKFSNFIDSSLISNELDFNIRFFNITSLIDSYIKIFFQEDSYFSQYFLVFDQNVRNIVDKYKPIITRYNVLTTALNFKFEPDDFFINDEYFANLIKQYNNDMYMIFDNSYISHIKQFILDLPYIPERTRKYDKEYEWRNEFHDLQLKEVNNIYIYNDIFDEKYDIINDNLIQKIVEYINNRTNETFILDERIFTNSIKLYINENIYFNYSFKNNKPVYDNILFNRNFQHDDINVCDYLDINVIQY